MLAAQLDEGDNGITTEEPSRALYKRSQCHLQDKTQRPVQNKIDFYNLYRLQQRIEITYKYCILVCSLSKATFLSPASCIYDLLWAIEICRAFILYVNFRSKSCLLCLTY